jgi:hypothetical protein
MNKYFRGFLGKARSLLDGGGKLTLTNLKYYEYLKQVLNHYHYEDDRYLVYYWDFTKHYPHNPDYTADIFKTQWNNGCEIFKTNLIVSPEYGVSSEKREIYVRKIRESHLYSRSLVTYTPAETEDAENVYGGDWETGMYSENKKIYYLLGRQGMERSILNTYFDMDTRIKYDVFDWMRVVDDFFKRRENNT